MKIASICWNVHQHVQLWQSLFGGGQNQFGPFLLWENETKFVNGEKICINSWKGLVVEMASTVGRCINLLECCITAIEKWHQQLERASIVGMVI